MPDKHPLVVVMCAIVSENHIVLIRREKPPYRGYLALPGGKLEFGETVTAAAIREAKEETGLDSDFVSIGGIATETIEADEVESHFVLFVAVMSAEKAPLTTGPEGEVNWIDLSALDRQKLIETDLDLINRFVLKERAIEIPHFRVQRKDDDFSINTID